MVIQLQKKNQIKFIQSGKLNQTKNQTRKSGGRFMKYILMNPLSNNKKGEAAVEEVKKLLKG